MKDFKNMFVWKKSIDFCEKIYLLTRNFPKEEVYSLTNQIRRAAVNISSNIAEECGRRTSKDFANFLYNSLGSLKEVECQLIISKRLGYVKGNVFNSLISDLTEIGKMLSTFIKRLQTTNKVN